MSSFDSDNDFLHEDYYETNGNFYSANGVYQGWLFAVNRERKSTENGENYHTRYVLGRKIIKISRMFFAPHLII